MDYKKEFIDKLLQTNKIKSQNTLQNYKTGMNKFHKQFPDISQVKFRDIDRWFIHMNCSPGYKNQLLTTVSAYIDFLAKWELMDPEIAKNVQEIKGTYFTKPSLTTQKPIPRITYQQSETLAQITIKSNAIQKRKDQYLLCQGLMYFCGYRISETCEIRIDDIEIVHPEKHYYYDNDPAKGRNYDLEREKNISYAIIRMPERFIKAKYSDDYNERYLFDFCKLGGISLLSIIESVAQNPKSDYLLHIVRRGKTNGSKQKSRNFRAYFSSIIKKAGFFPLGLSPHSFRKGFASANDSLPAHIVAAMLAHNVDLPVTNIYQSSGRNAKMWWEIAQKNILQQRE